MKLALMRQSNERGRQMRRLLAAVFAALIWLSAGASGANANRFGPPWQSRVVVDRTGTFVFFLGDRFFGTVTAYVPGPDAARFSFTSGLAVQLLKVLEPELRPLINSSPIENAKPVIVAEPS